MIAVLPAALVAVTSSPVGWYLTRGAGVITLILLTVSVALGIFTSLDWAWPWTPRFVTVALHRNISLLSLVLLGIHVSSTVLDGFVPIGWISAVVPFTSGYHPVTVGLGAIALDLLLALTVTSMFRSRVGFATWRLVHWTAYACWPIAVLHGFLLGTDRNALWMLSINIVCVALVTGLAAIRLVRGSAASRPLTTVGSRT